MSRATEIAEREAAEAEAVDPTELDPEPEPEPDEDPELDPEPEPEPPSDVEIEARYKAIQTKQANYSKAQRRELEATGAPWSDCPCCNALGFVVPFDPFDPEDAERKAEVLAYFMATAPDYADASDAKACEACNALGEVLSGSRRPGHELKPCATCQGIGWVYVAAASPPPYSPIYGASDGANGAAVPNAGIGPDAWDRPPGHPHYGIAPSLIG